MRFHKSSLSKGYTIYEGKYENENLYFIERKSGFEIANFDIDIRGGLKIVHSGIIVDKNSVNLKDTNPLFTNAQDFIPVEVYKSICLKDTQYGLYSREAHSVLSNEYLKHKKQYVLLNGTIQEVHILPYEIYESHCTADVELYPCELV